MEGVVADSTSTAVALMGVLKRIFPDAVPGLVDSLLITTQCSPSSLLLGLLQHFPDVYQRYVGRTAATADKGEVDVTHTYLAVVLHLLKHGETEDMDLTRALWTVYIPLLRVKDPDSSLLQNQVAEMVAEATSLRNDWDAVKTSLLSLCLNSLYPSLTWKGDIVSAEVSKHVAYRDWKKLELELKVISKDSIQSLQHELLSVSAAAQLVAALSTMALEAAINGSSEKHDLQRMNGGLPTPSQRFCEDTIAVFLAPALAALAQPLDEQLRRHSMQTLLPSILRSAARFGWLEDLSPEKRTIDARTSSMQEVWICCESLLSHGFAQRRDAYMALALFADLLLCPDICPHQPDFSMDTSDMKHDRKFDIREEGKFWEVLKLGLGDADSLTRKRALHLFRIALSGLKSSTSSLKNLDGVEMASSRADLSMKYNGKAPKDHSTKRNKWAEEEATSLGVGAVKNKMTLVQGWLQRWDAFILLHETLEEYGTHLVEAAWSHQMSLLLQFTKSKGDAKDSGPYWTGTWSPKKSQTVDINFGWISVLWQRGFDHTNPQVRRLVMQSFLGFEWERIRKLSSLLPEEYVLGSLLQALDDASHHRDFGMKGNYSSATADGAAKFMTAYGASLPPRRQVGFIVRLVKAALSQSRSRPGLMTIAICLEAVVLGSSTGKLKPARLAEGRSLAASEAGILQSEEDPVELLELLKRVVESSKCHFNPKFRAKVCSHVLRAVVIFVPIQNVPFSRFAFFLSSFPRYLLIHDGSLHNTLMAWVCPIDSASASLNDANKWVLGGLQNMVEASLKPLQYFSSLMTDEDVEAWRMEARRWTRLLNLGLVKSNDLLGILSVIQQHAVQMYKNAYTTVGTPERVLIVIQGILKEFVPSSRIYSNGGENFNNPGAGDTSEKMLTASVSNMVLAVMEEVKDYARRTAAVFWEQDHSKSVILPPSLSGKLGGPSQRRLPSTLTSAVLQAIISVSTIAECCTWCCGVGRQLDIPESVQSFLWQYAWEAIAQPKAMNELNAELQLAAQEALVSVCSALAATAHPYYVAAAHASMTGNFSSLLPVKAELMVDGLINALLQIIDGSAIIGALARSRRAALVYSKWSCLDSLLSIPMSNMVDDQRSSEKNKLLSAASSPILQGVLMDSIESLESASEECLLPILRCIRWLMQWDVLALVETDDDPEKKYQVMWTLVQSGWSAIGDCNKRRVAPTAAFLSAIFHPSIFGDPEMHGSLVDDEEHGPLKWLLNRLLEQGYRSPRTMRLTALHITGLWQLFPAATLFYIPELKILALHGGESVDEELDGDIMESQISAREYVTLIESSDPELSEEFTNSEMYVRVMVALMVDKLATLVEDQKTNETGQLSRMQAANFGQRFLLELLNAAATDTDLSKELYKKKSAIHRRKVRVWQLLCILSRFLTPQAIVNVMSLLKICLNKNNMPSVRQYIEIFSVQFYLQFPHLVEESLIPILHDYNMKPQALSSYVLIASNVLISTPAPQQKPLLQQVLPAILPFMTSHHHSLRSFTQVLIYRIFSRFSASDGLFNFKQDSTLEGPSLRAIADYLEGNADCTRMRISVEKHLDAFDPISMTKPRGIFCSKVGEVDESRSAEDHTFECVPVAIFDQVGYFLSEAREELRESMSADAMALSSEQFGNLQAVVGTSESHMETPSRMITESAESVPNGSWDIQKKIASLRFSDANSAHEVEEELLLASIESRAKELVRMRGSRQDLVVVASLLGRVPNLAGLARTCEVFKASSLVVADAKIADDRQFQLISVTADQWIPLVEVPEATLSNYLQLKRKEGYCILGLEQTANSISIDKYLFPKKVVLVLGRESEGIPVDVIHMLDACVEIPQLGVIRSLNVHVSGSIAIWEYTRQHLNSQQ